MEKKEALKKLKELRDYIQETYRSNDSGLTTAGADELVMIRFYEKRIINGDCSGISINDMYEASNPMEQEALEIVLEHFGYFNHN